MIKLSQVVTLVRKCEEMRFYAEHGYTLRETVPIVEGWLALCGQVEGDLPAELLEASFRYSKAVALAEIAAELDVNVEEAWRASHRVTSLLEAVRGRYALEIVRYALGIAKPTPEATEPPAPVSAPAVTTHDLRDEHGTAP